MIPRHYHEANGMKEPIIEGTFTDVLFNDMRGFAAAMLSSRGFEIDVSIMHR